MAAALAEAGIATWNVEYRRAGSPGGGWPTTFQDVAAATDYVKQIAAENHLDVSRVIVVGHSAGGQLALWLAARGKLTAGSELYKKAPLAVDAVVDVDGPPDLASAQAVETQFCPVPGITELMGGTPAEKPERYRDGSGQSFLPLKVPVTIVEAGLLTNAEGLVKGYVSAAKAKGEDVTVVKVEGSHFTLLDPASGPGKALLAAIEGAVGKK